MTRLATNACLALSEGPAGTPPPAAPPRRPTLYLASHRHPDGTVTTYGAPGAPNNTAGRITRVVSRSTLTSQGVKEDSEERKYGSLGEVTYEKKTVVPFSGNPGQIYLTHDSPRMSSGFW